MITVDATGPVLSYAAVIDNATTDPIFVVGAPDAPPGTPTITRTPTITLTPTITFTPIDHLHAQPHVHALGDADDHADDLHADADGHDHRRPPQSRRRRRSRELVTRTPTVNPNRIVLVGPGGQRLLRHRRSRYEHHDSRRPDGSVELGFRPNFHSTCRATARAALHTRLHLAVLVENEPYSYTHTFNTPGTFAYYCSVHGVMMQGAVNVLPLGAR